MPPTETELLAKVPTSLFIGGHWVAASDSGTFDVFDPATGTRLVSIADATPADGLAALDAAVSAAEEWEYSSRK